MCACLKRLVKKEMGVNSNQKHRYPLPTPRNMQLQQYTGNQTYLPWTRQLLYIAILKVTVGRYGNSSGSIKITDLLKGPLKKAETNRLNMVGLPDLSPFCLSAPTPCLIPFVLFIHQMAKQLQRVNLSLTPHLPFRSTFLLDAICGILTLQT